MLIDNPVLLLFIVIGVGGALGSVRVKGVALGPAAALFVGLAFSAFDERLANTPLVVSQIGLALFIYTIGLASGPSFLAELRRGGARVLVGVAVLLGLITAGVAALGTALDFDAGARAGLFAGDEIVEDRFHRFEAIDSVTVQCKVQSLHRTRAIDDKRYGLRRPDSRVAHRSVRRLDAYQHVHSVVLAGMQAGTAGRQNDEAGK